MRTIRHRSLSLPKADGIKLDYTGGTPPPGEHKTARELHGMEYLHTQFAAIHDAAKAAKEDCLLDLQVANPHFAALYDMTRLNDFFLPPTQSIRVMSTRARIARTVSFGALVDVDGPRHEDYFRYSHQFGNMSLYVTSDELDNPLWVEAIKEGIAQAKRERKSGNSGYL